MTSENKTGALVHRPLRTGILVATMGFCLVTGSITIGVTAMLRPVRLVLGADATLGALRFASQVIDTSDTRALVHRCNNAKWACFRSTNKMRARWS